MDNIIGLYECRFVRMSRFVPRCSFVVKGPIILSGLVRMDNAYKYGMRSLIWTSFGSLRENAVQLVSRVCNFKLLNRNQIKLTFSVSILLPLLSYQ
ncbi:hypothetical protein HanIR_Chr12g0591941 [Helianthus annuus]|nr:hypothetical protein HanIR_Chr12g0591941 [Helianthus annuus]